MTNFTAGFEGGGFTFDTKPLDVQHPQPPAPQSSNPFSDFTADPCVLQEQIFAFCIAIFLREFTMFLQIALRIQLLGYQSH